MLSEQRKEFELIRTEAWEVVLKATKNIADLENKDFQTSLYAFLRCILP